MEILKIATQTLQLAIQTAVAGVKSVVDAIKTTTDATKIKVDTTANKVDAIDVKVGSLFDGRVVKSIQRGAVSTESENNVNIKIASINIGKSVLLANGTTNGSSYVKSRIVDSTTINLYGGAYMSAEWQVIEFY